MAYLKVLIILPCLLITGCVILPQSPQSQILTFSGKDALVYPPVVSENVEIYRTRGPYASFLELGAISFRRGDLNLSLFYDQLRKDSGAVGAQAIVDLKFSHETHTEQKSVEKCETKTECNFENQCESKEKCHTEWVTENVTTYLGTGTMIRSKQ